MADKTTVVDTSLKTWVQVSFAVVGVLVALVGALLLLGYDDLKNDLSKIEKKQSELRTVMNAKFEHLSGDIDEQGDEITDIAKTVDRHDFIIKEELLPHVRRGAKAGSKSEVN